MKPDRAYDAPEEVKTSKKWLDPYLRQFDPETEYERIISIFTQYSLDQFSMHFTVLTGTMHNIQTGTGAETLAYTNWLVRRPARRNESGLAQFWIWFAKGPSHPDTKASMDRLNKIHMAIAKSLPGNFGDNDEYIYTLCMIGIFNYRLFRKLGLPDMPEYLKIAFHHVLRDLSVQFEGEHGMVHSFPEDFDGLVAFVEEFDDRNWPGTPVTKDICEAMMVDFSDRWFPRGMRWFGRAMMLYASNDAVLQRYGVKTLGPVRRALVHRMMKAMFYAKIVLAPDNKVSFLDTWKPMSREEIKAYDADAAQKADRAGWVKPGTEALTLSEIAATATRHAG